MRSANTFMSVAALAGLAMASPAPQLLDFNQLASAAPVQSAPLLNGVPDQVATLASVASVTTTATASVTGAATSAAVQKRDAELEKRTFGTFSSIWCTWFGIGCATTSSNTGSKVVSTSSAIISTSAVVASVSSAAAVVTSAYTPYYPALSTVTQYTTGTTTISSTSACPTTPEDGTYCGFINPEDPCAPQPDGYGPVPTPDTVSAFYAYAPFHSMASAAPTTVSAAASTSTASSVPMVYQQTFKDLNASSSAQSYLGLMTMQTYSVAQCAAYCDATDLCTAFNIYIERDPSVAPSANDSTAPTVWGYWCPNPASMTSYKCTIWGSSLDATTATNTGSWREQFAVVVTASNGYDKTNVTVPDTPTGNSTNGSGWSAPVNCGGKAINATPYWMGSKFYPGPYNPQLCADYAVSQNSQNKAAAQAAGKRSYTPCNMVNAQYFNKNNKPYGTYCALYDTDVSVSKATYQGGNSGSDSYTCKQSYKFTLKNQDNGRC